MSGQERSDYTKFLTDVEPDNTSLFLKIKRRSLEEVGAAIREINQRSFSFLFLFLFLDKTRSGERED